MRVCQKESGMLVEGFQNVDENSYFEPGPSPGRSSWTDLNIVVGPTVVCRVGSKMWRTQVSGICVI